MAGWRWSASPSHYRYVTVTLPLYYRYGLAMVGIAVTSPSHYRYITVTLPLQAGDDRHRWDDWAGGCFGSEYAVSECLVSTL